MYSQLNTKCIEQRKISFKVSKPEMNLITKEISLLRRRKEDASP